MKIKALLSVIFFGLSASNIHASTLINDDNLESFISFHKMNCNEINALQDITSMFNVEEFAQRVFEIYPRASNCFVEYLFIKASAEAIIQSPEYSSDDWYYFNLVEALHNPCVDFYQHSHQ